MATTFAARWLRSSGLLLLLERFGILATYRSWPETTMDHRTKLGWARQHLDTLKSEMRDFIDSQPYGMTYEYDVQRAKYVVKLRVIREMPTHWCLRVGDVIYNARSALDTLTYALAVKNLARTPTGDEVKQIQFAIVDAQINWNGECGRRLRHLHSGAQALIERMQPYHRPDPSLTHWLAVLRDLSNIDKHRHLLLVHHAIADARLSVEARGSPLSTPLYVAGGWSGLFEDETEIATFEIAGPDRLIVPRPDQPEVNVKSELTFDIAFGDGPAYGASILEFCTGTLAHIERMIFPALEPFL